ncbi:uncharacterized protein LOC127753930 isoform X2 [Oryza glaberrima]|uniref:uncharacterized protein LOC127753930 isoform X2 n=1 Tax=Oryza glaberrima TaxID=4538 RepID=UPI00224C1CA2|nr:uncharacterized protein LOC127753930 isoform X2 [Oryza glaberrima]
MVWPVVEGLRQDKTKMRYQNTSCCSRLWGSSGLGLEKRIFALQARSKRHLTIMASSPDKGKETAAAAVDPPSSSSPADSSSGSSPDKKENNNNNMGEAAAVAGDEGKKKKTAMMTKTKKMVRMSQSYINLLMSFDPPPLEPVRGLTKEEDRFARIDALAAELERGIRAVAETVRTQYEQGGYVEYEPGADLLACPDPESIFYS